MNQPSMVNHLLTPLPPSLPLTLTLSLSLSLSLSFSLYIAQPYSLE